jgi:ribosomal protein L11 methyltransferase
MAKYLVRCVVPYNVVENFQKALEGLADSIMVFEDLEAPPSDAMDENGFPIASMFQVDMLCEDVDALKCKAHAEATAHLLGLEITAHIEEVKDTNWLLACHQGQPDVYIHPFIIHSSASDIKVNPGLIALKIDAATAFGSGEHPTTQGCLKLFGALAKKHKFVHVLDMGCGSGILSIAAKKLQPFIRVMGVDIETEAVRRTRLNTRLNACEHGYKVVCSVGFQNPKTQGIYDLCFANILAKPLMRLAPKMQHYIKANGYVIASGLLDKQASMVIQAYKTCGFAVDSTISIQGWQSIVFRK